MTSRNRSSLPPLNKSPESKVQNNADECLFDLDGFTIIDILKSDSQSVTNIVENNKSKQKLISKTIPVKINVKNKKIISNQIQKLLKIQNPSINSYEGFAFTDFDEEDNLTLFMNYVQNGHLQDISDLDNTKKQKILLGISYGMIVLHNHNIVHGNLKPQNVLLTSDFQPIISDYGLSKFYHAQNFLNKITSSLSLAAYVAPEIFSDRNLTQKSDVYAFGILMFEIIESIEAYSNLSDIDSLKPSSLIEKVQNGLRPEFENTVKDGLKSVILQCLSIDPNERPTFSEIFQKLSPKEEENEFLLDDVNIDEVTAFVESLTLMDKQKQSKKNPRRKINQIQTKCNEESSFKTIKELQKENSKLKKENSNLLNENNQIIDHMLNFEKNLFKIATVDIFNSFSLQSQLLFVSELISNLSKPNLFYTKLDKVLHFINQFNKKATGLSYVEIVSENKDDDFKTKNVSKKWQICIRSNAVELLHSNNSFKSSVFINFLKEIKSVIIELPYPSEMFESGNEFILALREKSKEKIKLGICINGIERTGPQFQDKTNIDSIRIGNKVESIEGDAFSESGSFKGCSNLSRIEISSSVHSIDNRSFKDCTSLTCIQIPYSVNFIGSYAFSCCKNLVEISIPSSIFSIENNTFDGCVSLKKITIPSSVSNIGQNAFKDCVVLSKIELPDSIVSIGESAFYNCENISKIHLPNHLSCICNFTFQGCRSLSSVDIPQSVSEIGFKAFMGCTSLKTVKIHEVKSIGNCAFQNCNSLEKVKVPSTVSFIGDNAFPNTTKILKS